MAQIKDVQIFTTVPASEQDPSSGDDLVRKSYADTHYSGPIPWTTVTETTQAVSPFNGYVANPTDNVSLVTFTLPTSPTVGDTYYFAGLGAGGYKIAQNASQLIHFGSATTTTGTGGSLETTNRYDTIVIVCIDTNTFSVLTAVSTGFTVV